MALWQFDFHLLPRTEIERRFGRIATDGLHVGLEEKSLWDDVTLTSELAGQISQMLPSMESWSPDLHRWGREDGDRIEIVINDGKVEDFFIRVDVRDISQVFLINVLGLARTRDWVVRSENGIVSSPSLAKVLADIRASQSFRFVRDPTEFLAKLSHAQARSAGQPDDLL
jgi:hypothetical protein